MSLTTLILLVIKISIVLSVVAIGLESTFSNTIHVLGRPSLLLRIFTSVRAILRLVGDGTLLALGSFSIVGLIVGHLLGGPEAGNRPVLALATSARHPAVALGIAHANFPNQKLAGALVLVYLGLSAILAAPYLNWTKKTLGVTASEKQVEA